MELDEIEHKIACDEMTASQVFTQMKQHIQPKQPIEVKRGQMITLKEFGRIKFVGFDNYMGEVTAELQESNYRIRYKRIEEIEEQGYILIDS